MKRTRLLRNIMLTASLGVLASCNIYDVIRSSSSDSSPGNSQATSSKSHTSTEGGELERTDVLPFSLREVSLSTRADVLPSEGDLELLLLPIEFTDSPFTQQTLKDIEIAVNGTPEETNYWESVSSFYDKSSFGKSHLHYTIADVYSTGMTQRQVYEASKDSSGETDNAAGVIGDAYQAYLKKNGNTSTQKFDSDKNGWIDGVVAVYSGHNYTQMRSTYDQDGFYWAYTYWTVGSYDEAWTQPNVNCPTPNVYIWLSYDFFYNSKSKGVDAHTLIHETGHMYGLDDYYSNTGACLAGGHAMMDENVVDHDAYSKMMLGWTKPYIADQTGTINITPSQEGGDCILIPSENWNGTAYDDYLLLELYTPTGLNYLDSHTVYENHDKKAYSVAGIKLYHVDSRLVEIRQTATSESYSYMANPDSGMKENTRTEAYGYRVAASNCYKSDWKMSGYSTDFALLHMIEADGTADFVYGRTGENDDLFTKGSFSMNNSTFRKFFNKRDSKGHALLNSGLTVPYSIFFDEVTDEGATILIEDM